MKFDSEKQLKENHPYRKGARKGQQYLMMCKPNGATVQDIMSDTNCSVNRVRACVSEIRRHIADNIVITHSNLYDSTLTRYKIACPNDIQEIINRKLNNYYSDKLHPLEKDTGLRKQYLMMCEPNGASARDIMEKTNCRMSRVQTRVSKIKKHISNLFVITTSNLEDTNLTRYKIINQHDIEKSYTKFLDVKSLDNTSKMKWFSKFISEYPNYLDKLTENFINSEDTYKSFQHQLDETLINKIESYKLKFSIKHSNNLDLIKILNACPNWILDLDIEKFSLSSRVQNTLKFLDADNLRTLLRFKTQAELLKTPNFGRTSIKEIIKKIIAANEAGKPLSIEDYLAKNITLLEELEQSLNSINDEKYINIIKRRLGYFCTGETLEAISLDYSITRERVRQIQSKILIKMIKSEYWVFILNTKIKQFIKNPKNAIFLEDLVENDPWFSGLENQINLFKNIIYYYSEIKVYFLDLENGTAISQIDNEQWKKTIRETLDDIDYSLQYKCDFDDVELIIQNKLRILGAENLFDSLVEYISSKLNISNIDDELIVTSIGDTKTSRLKSIFSESNTPLHASEVKTLYKEKFGIDETIRSIISAINHGKFLTFSRGTYGMEKHIPISTDLLKELVNQTIELIKTDTHRQWSTQDLLNQVYKRKKISKNTKIDKYILNIGLRKYSDLVDLGRLTWMYNSDENLGSTRIMITDAINEIILNNNGPISIRELTSKLQKIRNTNVDIASYIMFHQKSDNDKCKIIQIEPGVFGLLSRDVEHGPIYWNNVLDKFKDYLKSCSAAVHSSEIVTFTNTYNFEPSPKLTILEALIKQDKNIKFWPGGFYTLASSDTKNRYSLTEGVEFLLRNKPKEINMTNFKSQLSDIVTYKYSQTALPRVIANNGYIYDHIEGKWIVN